MTTGAIKMDLRDIHEKFMDLLKLKEYPIGIKFAKKEDDFKGSHRIKKDLYSCQLMKIASCGDFLVCVSRENLTCLNERLCFGFEEIGEEHIDTQLKYAKDRHIAQKQVNSRPTLNLSEGFECIGIVAGPLSKMRIDPDVIAITVDPWQATRLVHSYLHETGDNLTFVSGTNALPCAYGLVHTFNTGRPNLVLPCSGARIYGKFQDNDMTFTIPVKLLDIFLLGLVATDNKKLSVPLLLDLGYPPKNPMDIFKNE